MAVQQKAVEDDFEGFDGGHVDLWEEAVFTGDAMALATLRGTLRQLGDLAKLARTRSDSDRSSDGQTDGGRVDLDVVATDDISAPEHYRYASVPERQHEIGALAMQYC